MAELVVNIGFEADAADAISSIGEVSSGLQNLSDSASNAVEDASGIGQAAKDAVLFLNDNFTEAFNNIATLGKGILVALGGASLAVGGLSAAFPPLLALEAPILALSAAVGTIITVAWVASAGIGALATSLQDTEKPLRQLQEQQKYVNTTMGEGNRVIKQYGDEVKITTGKVVELNSVLKDTVGVLSKAAEKWTDFVHGEVAIETPTKNLTKNFVTLRAEVAALFNYFSKGGEGSLGGSDSLLRDLGLAIGAISAETDKFASRTQNLTQAQQDLIKEVANSFGTVDTLKKKYLEVFGIEPPKNVLKGFLEVRQGIQSIYTEAAAFLASTKGDLKSFDDFFAGLSSNMKKAPDDITKRFVAMSREINGSVVAVLGDMVRLNSVAEEVKQSGATTAEEISRVANAQRAALQAQAEEIRKLSERTGVSVDEINQALADKASKAISHYQNLIDNETKSMIEAARVVAEASNNEFSAALEGFLSYISGVSDRMRKTLSTLDKDFKSIMDNLKENFGKGLGGDLSTSLGFSELQKSIQNLVQVSTRTFQDMKDNATKRIAEMTQAYNDMLEEGVPEKDLNSLSQKILAFSKKAGEDLSKVGVELEKALKAALDNVTAKIQAVQDKIKEISKQQVEEAKKSQEQITNIHEKAEAARISIAQKGMNAEQLLADKIVQIKENNRRAEELRAKGDETSLAKAAKLYEQNIALAQSFSEVKVTGYERMDEAGKRQIDAEIAQLKNTQNLTEAQQIRLKALEEFKTTQQTIVDSETARIIAVKAVNQAEKNLSDTESQASSSRQKAFENEKEQLNSNLEALQKLSEEIKGGLSIKFDKEGAKSDFEELVEELPGAKVRIDAEEAIANFKAQLEEVQEIQLKFDLTHLTSELQNAVAEIKVNADLSEFANKISDSVKTTQEGIAGGIANTFKSILESASKVFDPLTEKMGKAIDAAAAKQMEAANSLLQRVQDLLSKPLTVNVAVKEGQGFGKAESWG